jgi:ribosome-associated heat shock protein Hsp15
MTEDIKVRLDKWLWAIRIYKTRNQAAEACRKGRILVNGMEAKPSREIRVDDIVVVRKLPVIYTYKVLILIEHRQSASIARDCMEDLTSVDELNKLRVNDGFFARRDRGAGRPTKKERRTLDNIINNLHK